MIEGDEYALGARDPFGAVKEAAVLCGKRKNQSRKERTKLHQNGVCTAVSVPRAEQKYRIEHLGIGGHTNGIAALAFLLPFFHRWCLQRQEVPFPNRFQKRSRRRCSLKKMENNAVFALKLLLRAEAASCISATD